MSQREAFLQAILEAPEDDAPWLIFADWIEDNSDPQRAKFVRTQCRLAALDEDDPQRRVLQRLEYDLLAEHGGEWAAPFVGRVSRWQFRRGFVEQIKCDAGQFLKEAKRLLALAPIRDLHLSHPGKDEFARICASKHLRGITRLNLDHARLGDGGVAVLANSANVEQLTELSLKWNELTTAGLLTLAGSTRLKSLRSATFYERNGGRGEDADFRAFVRACKLPAFERLQWSRQVTPDSVRELLDAPLAGRLKHLSLHRIGAEGVRLLAGFGAFGRLESLDVNHGEDVDAEAVGRLAASGVTSNLRALRLYSLGFGDAGAVELARAPAAKLTRLGLSGNKIGEAGAKALAQSPLCASLTRLDLSNNPIGDRGATALAKSPHLGNLRHLDVHSCDFGWRGACALLDAPFVERLTYLGIEGNEIGTKARDALHARSTEQFVHDLSAGRMDGPEIIRRVKAEPPRCVRGLGAKPDSELIRRFPRERRHALEYATVAFELTHPDPAQRATLLGYASHNNLFLSPYAIRWDPSGLRREFFDAEQHGKSAEHDGNCTMTGSCKRVPWTCGRPGCRDHRFVVTFIYRIEYPPQRYHFRHLPIPDQFYHFDLDAYCGSQDRMLYVASFECK